MGMVYAGVTIGLDAVVAQHGGSPARVIEASGLQHALSTFQPQVQASEIPLSGFSSLLSAAARETRRPTFSLEFAQAFDVRSLGAVGYLFELAPDLGTALKDFCAAFELLQENTEIGVEVHGDLARIVYSVRVGTPDEKAPDAEFSVTMLGAALCRGFGERSNALRLDLEHAPLWEREAAPEWLGDDIRPGSTRNAIYVPRSALNRPGRHSDAYLYRIVADRVFDDLRNLGSRNDLVSMVVKLLKQGLEVGTFEQLSAPDIARQLGLSLRSLHRELASQGTRFRDLKNGVMLDGARLLLSDGRHSVTDTAFALGFSDTSAFSRAFRQLSGQSPALFRKARTGRG